MNGETITNGWPLHGTIPQRSDVAAVADLSHVRRILAIDVTPRTIAPSHEWALRESDAPVRLEVGHGATREEVLTALAWLEVIVKRNWPYLVDEVGCVAVGNEFRRADLSRGTIGGKTVFGVKPGVYETAAGIGKLSDAKMEVVFPARDG